MIFIDILTAICALFLLSIYAFKKRIKAFMEKTGGKYWTTFWKAVGFSMFACVLAIIFKSAI